MEPSRERFVHISTSSATAFRPIGRDSLKRNSGINNNREVRMTEDTPPEPKNTKH